MFLTAAVPSIIRNRLQVAHSKALRLSVRLLLALSIMGPDAR
jgi:hypothetical protein